MREPDFFLVGAPKCGTTALYSMIGAHPNVFVSVPKEPDFFAADIVAAARPKDAVPEWRDYLQLFAGANGAVAAGEGSVSYLASRTAASAIRARVPQARILMVLRDPADRVFAHYTAARASGSVDAPFLEWLDRVLASETVHAPVGPVTPGRYATHLEKYRREFPAGQLHIVWHDDFVKQPTVVLRGIFTFLGVSPDAPVPSMLRANETSVARATLPEPIRRAAAALPASVRQHVRQWSHRPVPWTMTPEERHAAASVYAADVSALAIITGRPLAHWLPRPR